MYVYLMVYNVDIYLSPLRTAFVWRAFRAGFVVNKICLWRFLFNNQPDALIIQIYSVIKLYMFRTTTMPIIRSFLLYIRHC
jgi:hypothetical protein